MINFHVDWYLSPFSRRPSIALTDVSHQRHPGPAHRCLLLLSTFHRHTPACRNNPVCMLQALPLCTVQRP